MNPLSSLTTTLQHELGLDFKSMSADVLPHIETLQAVIMEGAIATFLTTADAGTAQTFVTWVETHQSDPDLITHVFQTFPALLPAVHDEMVAAIESVKKNITAQ